MTIMILSPHSNKKYPSLLEGDLPLLLISSIGLILNMIIGDVFGVAFSLALLAYILVNILLPTFSQLLLKANLTGIDLHKKDKTPIPSCLGLLGGLVYLAILSTFIPFPFFKAGRDSFLEKSLGLNDGERLGGYTAAIASIGQMILLGFVDDVFGLKWRHKIILPAIASLPLLTLYRLTNGVTFVIVPKFIKSLFRLNDDTNLIELGIFYYIYMSMMAVFCTHSINILAGVNGVEIGQTIVIAASVIVHSLLTLYKVKNVDKGMEYHFFSLYLLLPFLAISLALWRWNRYPAKIFIGDTFCYFAGMVFAVVGILGHFSKTMMLFFMPQIFNFIYSSPQLFGLFPCPRHRLPDYDEELDILKASTFKIKRRGKNLLWCLQILSYMKIIFIQDNVKKQDESKSRNNENDENDEMEEELIINNFTILNWILGILGPMKESTLTNIILIIQVLCSSVALLVRHQLVKLLFST